MLPQMNTTSKINLSLALELVSLTSLTHKPNIDEEPYSVSLMEFQFTSSSSLIQAIIIADILK